MRTSRSYFLAWLKAACLLGATIGKSSLSVDLFMFSYQKLCKILLLWLLFTDFCFHFGRKTSKNKIVLLLQFQYFAIWRVFKRSRRMATRNPQNHRIHPLSQRVQDSFSEQNYQPSPFHSQEPILQVQQRNARFIIG